MKSKKLPVIVLAGFSCAGKSTLSKRLVDLYGFDLVEQYVVYSSIAHTRGYKRTRHWLADVGNEVFVKETTLESVRRINSLEGSMGVVIDASYGPLMDDILRSGLVNVHLVVVAIKADERLRAVRMASRMGVPDKEALEELTFRDGFLSAVNLELIMEGADIEVVNKGDINEVLGQMVDELARLGIPKPHD